MIRRLSLCCRLIDLIIMASSRRFPSHCICPPPSLLTTNRFFMITLTNFPHILDQTESYHRSTIESLSIIDDPNDDNTREAILYNTLKHQLEQALRSYLEQTSELYPISLVIDMRDLSLSR